MVQAVSGQYQDMSLDNSDLHTLLPKPDISDTTIKVDRQFDQWHDAGYWLVLLLLPLSLSGFRRGWLMLVIVTLTTFPGQDAMAFEWTMLWQNRDQRAARALEQKQNEQAAELFVIRVGKPKLFTGSEI